MKFLRLKDHFHKFENTNIQQAILYRQLNKSYATILIVSQFKRKFTSQRNLHNLFLKQGNFL